VDGVRLARDGPRLRQGLHFLPLCRAYGENWCLGEREGEEGGGVCLCLCLCLEQRKVMGPQDYSYRLLLYLTGLT